MKKTYLLLSIVGFILPNILVTIESVETLNILLYTNITATMQGMFANRISTIFMIDLLFTVMVFFIWSYFDAKKNEVKKMPIIWVLTMLLGIAGGFPLYLYFKEKAIERSGIDRAISA